MIYVPPYRSLRPCRVISHALCEFLAFPPAPSFYLSFRIKMQMLEHRFTPTCGPLSLYPLSSLSFSVSFRVIWRAQLQINCVRRTRRTAKNSCILAKTTTTTAAK